jgi:DAACS family dicarboxylate/amino acid:cation (Na+ or H+) symporter
MNAQATKKMSLNSKMFIGLLLGTGVGVILQMFGMVEFSNAYIAPLGNIMVKGVKMLVIPLIISSLIAGLSQMGENLAKLGRVCLKAVAFFTITMSLSTCIGIAVVNLIPIGAKLNLTTTEVLDINAQKSYPNIMTIVEGFVPSNIVKSMAETEMLPCIFFSVLFAVALLKMDKKSEGIRAAISNFSEAMLCVLHIFLHYFPIGIAALMANTVANFGFSVIFPLLNVVVMQIVIIAGFFLLLYIPLMVLYCKIPVRYFFKACYPAMIIAFSTASSMAALSLNMEAGKKLGISESIADLVVVMGNTMNMAGLAMYIGLSANFAAQAFNIPLSMGAQLVLVFSSVLMAMGMAGVPGATMLLAGAFMQVGLPQAGVMLLAGIDTIGGMFRTWLNLTGDVVAALVVAKSENELDLEHAHREYGKTNIALEH